MSLINAVAGIDVGFSKKRRSSAVCLITWDDDSVDWKIKRYRATNTERLEAIQGLLGIQPLRAVALDGPLQTGLGLIGKYRTAERILTISFGTKIGKPGQSNSPVGIRLNEEANICAKIVRSVADVAQSSSCIKIDERCIVEAFPSSYLGMMIDDPESLGALRRNRSDRFFEALSNDGTLLRLLSYLLPDRKTVRDVREVRNHDDRASLVCAISALGLTLEKYCAVGDEDGWIILSPHVFIAQWARDLLKKNKITDPASGWICYD